MSFMNSSTTPGKWLPVTPEMVPDIPGDETVTVDDNVNELGSKPFVRTSRGVVGEAEGAALRGTVRGAS